MSSPARKACTLAGLVIGAGELSTCRPLFRVVLHEDRGKIRLAARPGILRTVAKAVAGMRPRFDTSDGWAIRCPASAYLTAARCRQCQGYVPLLVESTPSACNAARILPSSTTSTQQQLVAQVPRPRLRTARAQPKTSCANFC